MSALKKFMVMMAGGISPTDNFVDIYETTTGQITGQAYYYVDSAQSTRVLLYDI